MTEFSKTSKIALALAMPASVILACWLYFRWSSDEDYYGKKKVATSHNTRIKLLVPSKAVGTVIGKQGATIKRVQEETGARLHFNNRSAEADGKPRELMICGTAENAQKAELMVYQIIAEMPVVLTEQIQIPNYTTGRIIGKGGIVIRDLHRASGARIEVDKNQATSDDRIVTLVGSRLQIDVAIELIEEIVKNAEIEKHEKDSASSSQRMFVPREKGSLKTTAIPVEEDDHWGASMDDDAVTPGLATAALLNGNEGGLPSKPDQFLQVMVSAVEHPCHFWVQHVGSQSLELEQMHKHLSQQLAFEDVRESLAVTDPRQGDLVAAKFEEDDPVYYRARVLGVTDSGKVDLYFVDYGDNTYADMDTIYQLRPEFHEFPHQAIQCQLADVEPIDETVGWRDEDVTLFEHLVYCAEWKPLYAKVMTYARIDLSNEERGHGEGQKTTLRPCLQLIDTSGEQDVKIAEELVRRGHARAVSSTHTTNNKDGSVSDS